MSTQELEKQGDILGFGRLGQKKNSVHLNSERGRVEAAWVSRKGEKFFSIV